jgi:hypothetical protein
LLCLAMEVNWRQSANDENHHSATLGSRELIVDRKEPGSDAEYRVLEAGVVLHYGSARTVEEAKAMAVDVAREHA